MHKLRHDSLFVFLLGSQEDDIPEISPLCPRKSTKQPAATQNYVDIPDIDWEDDEEFDSVISGFTETQMVC